jgi:hypothetical protein
MANLVEHSTTRSHELSQHALHPITILGQRAPTAIANATGAGAIILDVTSRGKEPWSKFSPFYPHGGIPVSLSEGLTSMSVEGAWQGLKVFESAGVDLAKLQVSTMKGLKRSVRVHGRVLGHRAGLESQGLLAYADARIQLYLPMYRWMLEHRLAHLIDQLRGLSASVPVVLLDYSTNAGPTDLSRPLSHTGLIKATPNIPGSPLNSLATGRQRLSPPHPLKRPLR